MRLERLCILALPVILVACTSVDHQGTIAQLRNQRIDVKEEQVKGGLEKAMAGYERFLSETPNSPLAPEAIRRLADLKVESEYGLLSDDSTPAAGTPAAASPAAAPAAPAELAQARKAAAAPQPAPAPGPVGHESEADFERRAAGSSPVADLAPGANGASTGPADLERAGPLEAIALYKKLLKKYPRYRRNDQVLYQMSRAYEELGRIEEAMTVMDRLVRDFPHSHYYDEVQFRRAEYFFVHRKYLDAEDAYRAIVKIGVGSSFYQLALYKLGWTFYKQELYEEALDRFIALLDYKVSTGYDFAQTKNKIEHQRLEDTFRVISLSFSYLGGSEAVVDYFSRHGSRSYEDGVYRNLGEYYFSKRRYSDAVATYRAFVSRNPFHKMSPHFLMRVIEINTAGGFPSLVIEAKKEFATKYGLKAEYWQHFDPKKFPKVLGYLKTNLKDLANNYHALYQDKKFAKDKEANFKEALHWYREYLASFPQETESAPINYQLADLLLENRSFGDAAVEFEKTAYDYPHHEQSSKAGYAAVYAYRQYLGTVPPAKRDQVRREVVRSSLKFADTFPKHEKAAIVLGAAADDLYDMKDYAPALAAAQKLIKVFPGADRDVLRAAWLVVGHSAYELNHYSKAETAYGEVLALLPQGDKSRATLVDNLAASIYKQGEQAKAKGDYRAAANHFLRVGQKAPTSKILPTAEYDAAAALIELKDWEKAASVLTGFRKAFPGNKLQPEVTKKIAYVYKEEGKYSLAAGEYERIERESKDDEVRREALTIAAQLHEQAGETDRELEVYRRYVNCFPQPVESNLETRNKIADLLKARNDQKNYLEELRQIVAIDAAAGSARTDRTRYLAAKAGLVLAELQYDRFVAVRLVKPLKLNLQKKRELMKAATGAFGHLLDYQIGEVTAAATFYLAEIYEHFSKALTASERPDELSPAELEQYNLAIEEQAYPFEEKAITIHENNLKLIDQGIYNEWIDKSLKKLAKLVPARYDRPEVVDAVIASPNSYVFAINRPEPPPSPATAAQVRNPAAVTAAPVTKPGTTAPGPAAVAAPPAKPAVAREGMQDKVSAAPETKTPTAAPAPPSPPMAEKQAHSAAVVSAAPAADRKPVDKPIPAQGETQVEGPAPPEMTERAGAPEPTEKLQEAKGQTQGPQGAKAAGPVPSQKTEQDAEPKPAEKPAQTPKPARTEAPVEEKGPTQTSKEAQVGSGVEAEKPAKNNLSKPIPKPNVVKGPAQAQLGAKAAGPVPSGKAEQEGEPKPAEKPAQAPKPARTETPVKAKGPTQTSKEAQVGSGVPVEKPVKNNLSKPIPKPNEVKGPAQAQQGTQGEKSSPAVKSVESETQAEVPADQGEASGGDNKVVSRNAEVQ